MVHRMRIMAELDPILEELEQVDRINRTVGKHGDLISLVGKMLPFPVMYVLHPFFRRSLVWVVLQYL